MCIKCGACCCHLELSELYASLDDGTGVCIYFDKKSRLCTIYNQRPLLCRVDVSYELFKDQMSKEEYLNLNYTFCEQLRKLNEKMKEE